jgi:polysaccharide transporter, PST family
LLHCISRGNQLKSNNLSEVFQTPSKGIRELAVRGAAVTIISSGLGLVIQVVSTVALARLLTPRDFGLVAMVTTFSLLLVNFGLNGFTEAIIQRKEIDHALASNLFWINAGAGLGLAIGFAASGSLLARLYGNRIVEHIAVGISLGIALSSTSVIHLSLLKRGMRFIGVSVNDIIAAIVSITVSITLAFAGWGYWALVAGIVARQLAQCIGAWSLCRWIPGLPRRVPGMIPMIRFALNVYGRFIVNYFARNIDNVLVGGLFGSHSLGFYKKAYDLFALSAGQLTSPLTNVAVAALSRFNPHSVQYRNQLLGAVSAMSFVGMGLSVLLTLIGKNLLFLLLGPGWEPAGRIFVFFGPGIGAMLIYYIHGWIHLSIGRADRWLRWGLVEVAVTCLLFLLALPWGPSGIAMAWTLSFWILTIPALLYAGRPINLGITPILAAIWKNVAASFLAGCICAGIMNAFPSLIAGEMLYQIVMIALLFATLYLGAVILLHQGCAPLYQLAGFIEDIISSRKSRLSSSVADITCEQIIPAVSTSKRVGSKPLVSILIPAFNAQEWISETLQSAISQTWEPKEIIVVDDGSTDQTLAIARQFESNYLHVVTQNNQGAATARNTAFSLSHGEFIQWLDADDLLAPDKIAIQMEAADQCRNKKILFSSRFGKFMYRPQRAKFLPTALWCDLSPIEWLIRKMGQNIYMQTATWLVSRELTEAAGPWDERLLGDDDGEYFCRVLLASDGVRFVPNAKVYYRSPFSNTLGTIGRSDRKLKAHWLSMQLHMGYICSLEESERIRDACLRYLQSSLIYFYPERLDIVQQMEQTARDIGRQLGTPTLSWKYAWAKNIFGWHLAKTLLAIAPMIRWKFARALDKALLIFEKHGSANDFGNLKLKTSTLSIVTLGANPAKAYITDDRE